MAASGPLTRQKRSACRSRGLPRTLPNTVAQLQSREPPPATVQNPVGRPAMSSVQMQRSRREPSQYMGNRSSVSPPRDHLLREGKPKIDHQSIPQVFRMWITPISSSTYSPSWSTGVPSLPVTETGGDFCRSTRRRGSGKSLTQTRSSRRLPP